MDTVIHCNIEKNARLIAMILDFDEEGKEFDWYEQHIKNAAKHYEERIAELENRLNHPEIPDCSALIAALPEDAEEQIAALGADPDVDLALAFESHVASMLDHLHYLRALKAKGEAVRKAGWVAPEEDEDAEAEEST